MGKLKNTVVSATKNFISGWKTPPEGRYMTFKEIASLSGGGIGVRAITYCVSQMILSVGNSLIGNTIGIDPIPLYIIYVISLLSGFPLTALRARMIDNTRSMKGKYRPYLITMGIPTTVLGMAFTLMPYEHMTLTAKCVTVLLFNIGFQFFYNFYCDSYDSLINVLSPNSIERSDALSIRSIVENLSPSIVGLILPLFAEMITGERELYDLRIYRILYPPLIFIGFLISLIVYKNTEEKIVQAKSHYAKIRFTDALREVAKNKYFWVISLAGWMGFLENSSNNILQCMYTYQKVCSPLQYTIISTIKDNASFWPNLAGPYFIRKIGKKKILIYTNIFSIFLILLMLPIVRNSSTPHIIWLLLVVTFFNSFVTALGHLMGPSINADIRDYQQYVSGERIDGMFAAVGLIGNVITMITGSVLPVIYDKVGLNQATAKALGYSGDVVYEVLNDPAYFSSISSVLVIASVVGAIMNVIPFFFYDLTETKQKSVVSVLKIRAMFEDYGNKTLSDELLTEGCDIIRNAEKYISKVPVDLKKAKKSLSKNDYRLLKAENEQIEISDFIFDELNKFSTPDGKASLEYAKIIYSAGLEGFLNAELPTMSDIKNMPENTAEEKQLRRAAVNLVRDIADARKTAAKHYPNGIRKYDTAILDRLYAKENRIEATIFELSKKMKEAKENKRNDKLPYIREKIENRRKEKADIQKQIKAETKVYSNYRRAAKPYIDAIKTVTQAENYSCLDAIMCLYEKSI
ncbi:MAG: MFS transporter [Acutalibacteraceae bacterium]|nr:MFS transporter [Acutalibacteraceae bacterium]